jgi:hypothetical protein
MSDTENNEEIAPINNGEAVGGSDENVINSPDYQEYTYPLDDVTQEGGNVSINGVNFIYNVDGNLTLDTTQKGFENLDTYSIDDMSIGEDGSINFTTNSIVDSLDGNYQETEMSFTSDSLLGSINEANRIKQNSLELEAKKHNDFMKVFNKHNENMLKAQVSIANGIKEQNNILLGTLSANLSNNQVMEQHAKNTEVYQNYATANNVVSYQKTDYELNGDDNIKNSEGNKIIPIHEKARKDSEQRIDQEEINKTTTEELMDFFDGMIDGVTDTVTDNDFENPFDWINDMLKEETEKGIHV